MGDFCRDYQQIFLGVLLNFSVTFLGLKTLPFHLEKQKISSVLEEIDALVSAPICPCLFMLTYALLHALLCLRLSSAYIIFAPLCLRAGDKSVHQHTHHCGQKHDEYGVQSFAFDFHVCHHHQHAKYDEADIVKVTHAFPHRGH